MQSQADITIKLVLIQYLQHGEFRVPSVIGGRDLRISFKDGQMTPGELIEFIQSRQHIYKPPTNNIQTNEETTK